MTADNFKSFKVLEEMERLGNLEASAINTELIEMTKLFKDLDVARREKFEHFRLNIQAMRDQLKQVQKDASAYAEVFAAKRPSGQDPNFDGVRFIIRELQSEDQSYRQVLEAAETARAQLKRVDLELMQEQKRKKIRRHLFRRKIVLLIISVVGILASILIGTTLIGEILFGIGSMTVTLFILTAQLSGRRFLNLVPQSGFDSKAVRSLSAPQFLAGFIYWGVGSIFLLYPLTRSLGGSLSGLLRYNFVEYWWLIAPFQVWLVRTVYHVVKGRS